MSQKFIDNTGQEWSFEVSWPQVKAVRAALNFDLYGRDIQAQMNALTDPVLLVDVLFVLCRSQAERLGVSDEDFGRRVIGDPFDAAAIALVREVSALYPKKQAALLLRLVDEIERQRGERDDAEPLSDGEIANVVRSAFSRGAGVTFMPPGAFEEEPSYAPKAKLRTGARKAKTVKKKASRR